MQQAGEKAKEEMDLEMNVTGSSKGLEKFNALC